MKKMCAIVAVMAVAVPALAQFTGLPVAGGAAAPEAGSWRVSGGVVIGNAVNENDINIYGGRVTFAPTKGLALFGEAGAMDPDVGDMGLAFQGGAQYTLPLDWPVDLALRGVVGHASLEDRLAEYTALNLNGGVVVSKTFTQWTPYGFAGIDYLSVDIARRGTKTEDEVDPALAAGVLYAMNERLSFYGEVGFVMGDVLDNVCFGLGAGWNF